MSPPRKQHDQRVILLDNLARRNPRAFRFRIIALAALGYTSVLITYGAGLYLIFGDPNPFPAKIPSILNTALQILAGLFGGMLTGTASGLFSMKIKKQKGISLQREDCPKLFAMIDRVSSRLKARPPHHVLLNNAFNASHAQRPLLGALGWQINTISLGMPLLQMLSCEEIEEIIAHEIGHRAGNHSRFEIWVLRPGSVWSGILMATESGIARTAFPLRWFARWYVPLFEAYLFVQQRAHEYLADSAAAQATSPNLVAQTLTKIAIGQYLITHFHAPRLKAARASASESFPGVRQFIYDALRETPPQDLLPRWWTEICNTLDDPEEEHPCLRNRLANVGIKIDPASAPKFEINPVSAAEALLHPALPRLMEEADSLWRQS